MARHATPVREPGPPPVVTLGMDNLQPLGELKGSTWYKDRDDQEYERVAQRPIRDDSRYEHLIDGQVYGGERQDGVLVWWHLRKRPAGSFAAGGRLPSEAPKRKAPKPARPVDELARFWLDRPERLLTVGPVTRDVDVLDAAAVLEYEKVGGTPRLPAVHPSYRPAVPAPRGPAEFVARLAKRGIRCVPTIDGAFYVEAEAGRLDIPTRHAIDAAAPLLRAYLHGSPMRCALPVHVGGEPPEAVTLALGGAAMCASCAGG